MKDNSECRQRGHDFANAIKKGRAHWVCPICGWDISLSYVLWAEATQMNTENSKPKLRNSEADL